MQGYEREYFINRVVSGKVRVGSFYAGWPDRHARFLACELHREILRECYLKGVYSNEDALALLVEREIFTQEDEDQIAKLNDSIDDQKVGLYENWGNPSVVEVVRKSLEIGKQELHRLETLKHSLDHITCEGVAFAAKSRFLAGASLYNLDGTPYWTSIEAGWDSPDEVLDRVAEDVYKSRLNEESLRDIARNEPWKSTWGTRSHSGRGVFDIASIDLTDEQRALILWSSAYDSILEHSDCPIPDVIGDNDALDGWMILQKRKRNSDVPDQRITNEKIRNSDEVYIIKKSMEDARKIDKYNSGAARAIKARRLNAIRNKGSLSEAELPDVFEKLQMAATRRDQ